MTTKKQETPELRGNVLWVDLGQRRNREEVLHAALDGNRGSSEGPGAFYTMLTQKGTTVGALYTIPKK